MTKQFNHTTVLLEESVRLLDLRAGDAAVDCTAGGGGHTTLMLRDVGPTGKVVAIDQDQDAIDHLSEKFKTELSLGQLILVKANFSEVEKIVKEHIPDQRVKGICADLGVSSHQLDIGERGFSFRSDAPLDMRMNQNDGEETAFDFVNGAAFDDILKVLRDYGEEPKAYYIAKAIMRAREQKSIATTFELADLIRGAVHYKERSRVDPATRSFQAIRIKVNREFDVLEDLLRTAPLRLISSGRFSVISFHSLEDRLVKHRFQELSGKRGQETLPRDIPLRAEEEKAPFGLIKPFPLYPSDKEIEENPRSRSAKLRVLERL